MKVLQIGSKEQGQVSSALSAPLFLSGYSMQSSPGTIHGSVQ